ncbi:succinate dehydrogenase subunit B [Chthonomonas calidirosea]|uniref:succinate dehydrogenase/fumarate reductase iron-sulfur subunit n=1 Tax=Chthonomonas calidirosea TaxID=454171 RepID=UPI0006DD4B63|nr:succinate dehydrogenase/fumarate reductase iron-sulfur subunit [Chthonomonas calidirosea]CEK13964.1 succinate dehydrogenase subunit B [Chthonomonas calidirosea]CEK13965.1 succinate dehydrogenase subunit B [Chthonomonas calidirosea]
MEKVTLRVFRGDIHGGHMVSYEVPVQPSMVVLDAIHYIQQHIDPTLACRWNCKAAKCGSCSAEIDGKPRLMCKTRVDQFPSGVITVGPMRTFPLIKDLVTDVSWNYRVAAKIPPLQPKPEVAGKPFRMQQADVDRIQEFRKCIECFLCQDVCHILREHNRQDAFFGPRQMVRIAALDMHPMDNLNRREQLVGEAGVGMCNITKCCTEVCPEHIHITDNAIIPLKERVADDYFDPVTRILRRIGVIQHEQKQPMSSVPQSSTQIMSKSPRPGK